MHHPDNVEFRRTKNPNLVFSEQLCTFLLHSSFRYRVILTLEFFSFVITEFGNVLSQMTTQ